MPDGSIINQGGNIAGAIRVSLIPAIALLPRHDMVGQVFIRRFLRGFKRSRVGGFDRQAYFAEMQRQITAERIEARTAREAKGLTPELVKIESPKLKKGDEYMQVVCMESCRLYVRHSDGAGLITPPDYELYI